MRVKEFNELFEQRVDKCRNVLVFKAAEYADERERLHNFKAAGSLNHQGPEKALWGMATKHIISLADMIAKDEDYPQEMWDEKIGDALNYLFLLDAVIKDLKIEKAQGNSGHKV